MPVLKAAKCDGGSRTFTEVCETPLGAAWHACTEADLASQGSGFSCERSAELGPIII